MADGEELDLSIIPVYEVDFDRLESATAEDDFLRVSFELLKEAGPLVVMVAGTMDQEHTDGFTRNEAILIGHLVRMGKLIRAIIAGVAHEHGGDQQAQLVRQFLDSASTMKYLLEDLSDTSRFDAYIFDSLIAEKEFLKDIREQVVARGGEKWNIEERIERSIRQTFDTAGVTEADLPARKDNRWPSAQARLALFGPTAYSAYRIGSGAIHGSWHDLERHHLELVDGKFHPYTDPIAERPQPLFAMGLVGIEVAREYVDKCVTDAKYLFGPRFEDLLERMSHANDLHEEFLRRRFDSRNDDTE